MEKADNKQQKNIKNEKPDYKVNDIVRMKKKHPCGSDTWKILRTGMDFGIKCTGCGHFVMMPRVKFTKMAREIVERASD